MANKPCLFRFSIIIPLELHRGQVEACLRRWAREQTYPRDQYEIIAAGCRHSLDQEALALLESELRSHDRLLLYDEPHDIALCAHAAEVAQGEVLFFTESHCLPEKNALTRADEVLHAHPEWAGFSCRSLRITHNNLSIMAANMYEADIQYGMQEHPWRKILDHGFVVRTEHYCAAGGFRPELGHFAEWHLAAHMHKQGYAIGYAQEIQMWHHHVSDYQDLIDFSMDFTRGEMTYQAEFTHDACRSYFQAPTEWLTRHQWATRLARRTFRLGWRAHAKCLAIFLRPTTFVVHCRLLLHLGLRAKYGAKPALLWALIRFQLCVWASRLSMLLPVAHAARRFLQVTFLRLVDATIRLERMRFVQDWLAQTAACDAWPSAPVPAASLTWRPDSSYTFCAAGFHAVEEWHGRQFCGSEPVGMIEVSLLPGHYRFVIDWLPITNIKNLIVYLDEQPIPITRDSCQASGQFLQTISTYPSRFSWTCEPESFLNDRRLLGLPVASISWTRL